MHLYRYDKVNRMTMKTDQSWEGWLQRCLSNPGIVGYLVTEETSTTDEGVRLGSAMTVILWSGFVLGVVCAILGSFTSTEASTLAVAGAVLCLVSAFIAFVIVILAMLGVSCYPTRTRYQLLLELAGYRRLQVLSSENRADVETGAVMLFEAGVPQLRPAENKSAWWFFFWSG